MVTVTAIITGRIGDTLISTINPIVNEAITSDWDQPVKFVYRYLVAGTVNVEDSGGGIPYTEGVDYTINYPQGLITVLSTGAMADATAFDVDYDYTDGSLAVKVNAITTVVNAAGKTIYEVAMTRLSSVLGVAVIVYEA